MTLLQDTWTSEDEQTAFSQGWGLFKTCTGCYHIQKLDESTIFEDDFQAFDFVKSMCSSCEVAQKGYALDGCKF